MSKEKLIPASILREFFKHSLDAQLAKSYVKLLGVPEQWTHNIQPPQIQELNACFTEIIEQGNADPFYLSPDDVAEMPAVMGEYHLNSLLQQAVVCDSLEEMDRAASPQLGNPQLRQRFCRIVYEVRQTAIQQHPCSDNSVARAILLLNALRLNTPIPELYRPNLDRSVSELVLTRERIQLLIKDLVLKARTFLMDVRNEQIEVGGMLSHSSKKGTTHISWGQGSSTSMSEIQAIVDGLSPKRYLKTIVDRARIYIANSA